MLRSRGCFSFWDLCHAFTPEPRGSAPRLRESHIHGHGYRAECQYKDLRPPPELISPMSVTNLFKSRCWDEIDEPDVGAERVRGGSPCPVHPRRLGWPDCRPRSSWHH